MSVMTWEPCYWCRLADATTIDHLVPVSRGGTDDPANRVPACARCNSEKGAKTPQEYGRWLRARALVMAATCPACGAGPGERCVTVREVVQRPISVLHAARKETAACPG